MLIDSFSLLSFTLGLFVLQILLFVTSLFLILLILVQRGKGGGLTGALGGMGGQSAFGSRAGDAFTKITIVTAVIWITLCMVTIARYNPPPAPRSVAESIEGRSGMATSAGDSEEVDLQETEIDLQQPAEQEDSANNLLDFGLSDGEGLDRVEDENPPSEENRSEADDQAAGDD